jgi:hypothetical protein
MAAAQQRVVKAPGGASVEYEQKVLHWTITFTIPVLDHRDLACTTLAALGRITLLQQRTETLNASFFCCNQQPSSNMTTLATTTTTGGQGTTAQKRVKAFEKYLNFKYSNCKSFPPFFLHRTQYVQQQHLALQRLRRFEFSHLMCCCRRDAHRLH